jgi:Ca2+/Na+ antiporter
VKVLRVLAESLSLKSSVVGNIAGFATSMPELISVFFSSLQGLFSASLFNILSSNIINTIQYTLSIYLNKNQKYIQNEALKGDVIMSLITILIPLVTVIFNIDLNISFVPIFVMLFILFYIINKNTHKLYLEHVKTQEMIEIDEEKRWVKGKNKIVIKNSIYLIIIGIALFVVGELLGDTVKNLCHSFNIPEAVIGILLGFITSMPELITFFESQRNSKKHKENLAGVVEATNNLLTSNIINLFVVLTIGIVISSLI